jgi:hypothetical protein
MEVLYQLSYPGGRLTVAARLPSMKSMVPMIILGSGVLFATIGAGLLIVGEPLIGGIFVAVGVSDAIVALISRRRIEARPPSATVAPPPADAPGEVDPSQNPYARED